MDDNDSGCEDSGDAEAGGCSNGESNDHVDGGDGESIVDCGNDVDNDSSDKNNGMVMVLTMVVMMPIEVRWEHSWLRWR